MRPADLAYAVADRPPPLTCALNAVQHVIILSPALIYVLFVLNAAGATPEQMLRIISLSLVALGIGSMLQCQSLAYFGSGYLAAFAFDAPYLSASILAAQLGGMPLVFGMTMFAGFVEMGLSRIITRMRPYFPAEISGICVMLIGLILGVLGMRLLLGIPDDASKMGSVDLHYLALGVGTLALMIAIHVWAKGQLRTYSIILSVLIAYGCALYYGLVDAGALDTLSQASWFHVPLGGWQLPSFRGDLIVPFAFAALVCSLSVMGDITTCQKINDDEWVRPDMISLRNGVLTDGVCTAVSALIGSVGGDTSSPNVGLSSAAGVTSRVVGYWTGGLLILLAMMPVVAAAVVSIPRPIMGAAMLFTSC
jgi:xanthine permease XanP